MKSPYYSGRGIQREQGAENLPTPRRSDLIKPEKYLSDPGLIDAANVALMLGQPLLLTGEAGTGKTQFAYSLAWELKLGEPFKFETKSNSVARDLFYTYDALKRFQDVQSGLKPESILPYLTYQALGIAILCTRAQQENKGLVDNDFPGSEKPTRSVVLIDEIDKAPRDFPNDILNEIENMYFRIPEMGNLKVEANRNLPPIVVITSNSEKDLPDAFLRRCVYYNIPFPDRERLRTIVSNRLGSYVDGSTAFITDALDLFFALREVPGGLRKSPSTAEMLGWMMALKDMAPDAENPLAESDLALRTLSNLIKTTADQEKARDVVQRWLTREKSAPMK
jgi:MoxR-like ATPase